MRKLIAILFLAAIYFTLSGYHFIFRYQLGRAKTEMKTFLRHQRQYKDVIELSFDENELAHLEWENDHEFRYSGDMYDVIEITELPGKMVIRCISDRRETALLEQYKKAMQRTSVPGPLSALVKLVTAQYLLTADFPLHTPGKILKKYSSHFAAFLSDGVQGILTPPPKFC